MVVPVSTIMPIQGETSLTGGNGYQSCPRRGYSPIAGPYEIEVMFE